MTRDQEAILALTADNERLRELLREARDDYGLGMDLGDRIDAALAGAAVQPSACNHFPGQSTCEWCGAVQPERCCLDYPRCDCNSPPEPDNEWHCSQYPDCECFAGCREKALEVPL